MDLLIKLFFLTLLATPLILFAPKNKKAYLNLAVNSLLAIISTCMVILSYQQGTINYYLADLSLIGPIHLKIDELSSIFILVTNFTAVISSLYSVDYLKNRDNTDAQAMHLFSFAFLHASILLVCMIQDLLAFLVVWEIMSICSFLQLLFEMGEARNLKTAVRYFIRIHLNNILLVLAVVWLYSKTGMQNFEALHFYFSAADNFPLFILFFLGFGMTAGFVPLHIRLPQTNAALPCPSSAFLSGTITKLGIYGILRVAMYLQNDLLAIGIFIYGIAIISTLYGITQAAFQKDYKKLIAWSGIEHIGIIGMGIGIGILGIALDSQLISFMGFAGALLHVVNHSLFQSLLFYTAGIVFIRTGTRQTGRLGGLIKKMPLTAALFLIGCLAICGLPPFNGFVSAFLIYSGMIELLHSNFSMDMLELAALISLVITGGLSVFTFTRLFGTMFLGSPRSEEAIKATEGTTGMHIPTVAIALLMLGIGLAPELFVKFISRAVNLYMPGNPMGIVIHQFDSISSVGLASILLIIMAVTIYFIRTIKVKANSESYSTTWGYSYEGAGKFQYTKSSFTEKFFQLIKPVLKARKELKTYGGKDFFSKNKKSGESTSASQVGKQSFLGRLKNSQTLYYVYAFLFLFVLIVLTVVDIIR